jgi:hypothetical protein
MTAEAFETLQFSSANLFRALSNKYCDPNEIAEHARANYLYRYLHEIDAKTIVVEQNYTDGDYLEDFASYYVRCYVAYDRGCKRLHFFAEDLSDAVLRSLIRNELPPDRASAIRDSYLGFVVARPLPSAVVGRTILKTYPADGGRRHYTVVREYESHLFGTKLSVLSLPFQEQDSVLAACATVALWCAFHKMAALFGTTAPRPAVITAGANRGLRRGRPVPSHGLSIEEMCQAAREVGLEPELVDCVNNNVPLVSLAYGHLRMGVPVILIVDVEGQGRHAITLTGYSLKESRVHAQEVAGTNTCIPMIGLRIDEFYGHDDQVGPFARLSIGPSAQTYPVLLHGDWKDEASGKQLDLQPLAALIPIYSKIRVTFLDVQVWLTRLASVLDLIADPATIEWDLSLTTTNEYKGTVKGSTVLAAPDLDRLLLTPQPRFIWRALLRLSGIEVFELLVDATDMARSFPIFEAIWHHDEFRQGMNDLLAAPAMQLALTNTLTPRFLQFLKGKL